MFLAIFDVIIHGGMKIRLKLWHSHPFIRHQSFTP